MHVLRSSYSIKIGDLTQQGKGQMSLVILISNKVSNIQIYGYNGVVVLATVH